MCDAASDEVIKKMVYNKLYTTVNNLENKIPDMTTLIDINQHNIDNKVWRKNPEMFIKKYLTLVI